MRFVIDAQLPPALGRWLGERGHEAEHVIDALGGSATDDAVVAHAARSGAVLLSKDADFLAVHPPRRLGYRLVWLRCGNITNRRLLAWIEPRWEGITRRLEAGDVIVEVR